MSKITSMCHLPATYQNSNNDKKTDIKSVKNNNFSFLTSPISYFKNRENKNKACDFLKSTFDIPSDAKLSSDQKKVSYDWHEPITTYRNERLANGQKPEKDSVDASGISTQFTRDLSRVNYSITFLDQYISKKNDHSFQENKYQYYNELLTEKHMQTLSQIAHQGHLAIPRQKLKLCNTDNHIISQSKNDDEFEININKNENNEYIITSKSTFNLMQIEPQIRLEKTILSIERKTYLSIDKSNTIIEKENKKDDLNIKITQNYN